MAKADYVLAVANQLKQERDARLCRHCHKPYAEHTAALSMCPWPNRRNTKFSEMTCQAVFDGRVLHSRLCGRSCVPGQEYCSAHVVD
jgi:hypothetical protein